MKKSPIFGTKYGTGKRMKRAICPLCLKPAFFKHVIDISRHEKVVIDSSNKGGKRNEVFKGEV